MASSPADFHPNDDATTAVLLIAHGSRRNEANRDLVELACRLRERGPFRIVEVSYLELVEPTIPQGCQRCVAAGATRVLMLPYFLSAGTHATADLEAARSEQAAAYPQVDFRLCPPLGLHPLMVSIVLDRLAEGARANTRNR